MIGTTEILIIAGVVLVLFGASAIPKFARSIGKARSELERGMKEGRKEAEQEATPNKQDQERKQD